MRGAKFLGHTAKRRKKTGRYKPSGPLCRFHGELPSGCHCCAALVAPPLLRRIRRAGEHAVFTFPPLSVAPPRCVVPVVAPLRRIRRAGEHAVFAFPPPLRCTAPLRCSRCRPVARPLSGRRSRRFRAPSLLHWVAPFVLPLSRRVAPPPCRAAGFIAWRPAPDRSAGPRCRAPCGRCLPRSPTR